MIDYYSQPRFAILKGKKVVPVKDAMEWSRFFEEENRTVKKTWIGEYEVSTVFLGVNHSFGNRPLWFETLVFPKCGLINRYETWKEAIKGHNEIVKDLE